MSRSEMIQSFVGVVVICLLAGKPAVNSQVSNPVANHVTFNNGNYILNWTHLANTSEVEITVEANTTGWVAFGFSNVNSPKMAALDLFIGGVNSDGTPYLEDYYANTTVRPVKDSQNDFTLLNASENAGKTSIKVKRKLVTGDANDTDIQVGKDYYVAWAINANTDDPTVFHTAKGYGPQKLVLAPPAATTTVTTPAAPTSTMLPSTTSYSTMSPSTTTYSTMPPSTTSYSTMLPSTTTYSTMSPSTTTYSTMPPPPSMSPSTPSTASPQTSSTTIPPTTPPPPPPPPPTTHRVEIEVKLTSNVDGSELRYEDVENGRTEKGRKFREKFIDVMIKFFSELFGIPEEHLNIIIIGVRNGSVIVMYQVALPKQADPNKAIEAINVQVETKGSFGNYTVDKTFKPQPVIWERLKEIETPTVSQAVKTTYILLGIGLGLLLIIGILLIALIVCIKRKGDEHNKHHYRD